MNDVPHEPNQPGPEQNDPYQSPQAYPYQEGSELSSDVRNWAMLCHLSALIGTFTGFGFLIGPLVVWLVKKNDHPFIDEQGKESLNFQITMHIYAFVSGLLICLVIGIPMLLAVVVANVVLVVIAAIKVSSGVSYRYPLTIRLIN